MSKGNRQNVLIKDNKRKINVRALNILRFAQAIINPLGEGIFRMENIKFTELEKTISFYEKMIEE